MRLADNAEVMSSDGTFYFSATCNGPEVINVHKLTRLKEHEVLSHNAGYLKNTSLQINSSPKKLGL